MLAFRNEETFQLALKGCYTHQQSSILNYKASLLKVKHSHKQNNEHKSSQGHIYYAC